MGEGWGHTISHTLENAAMPDSGKPAGLHFLALTAPYVHTGGQTVKRGGLGRVPGRGEKMLQVNIKPASFCPYSVADLAVREELKQQGGWEDRPSTSCPPRSQ